MFAKGFELFQINVRLHITFIRNNSAVMDLGYTKFIVTLKQCIS